MVASLPLPLHGAAVPWPAVDPSPPGLRVAVAGMTLLCVFVLWQLANILYPLPAGHAHQEALASRIQALKADPDPGRWGFGGGDILPVDCGQLCGNYRQRFETSNEQH